MRPSFRLWKQNVMTAQTVVLHREGNLYVAKCPEVGTVSQGSTAEEAIANLQEATDLYLEEFPIARIDDKHVAQ